MGVKGLKLFRKSVLNQNQSKHNNQLVKYTFKPQHQNVYSPYRSLYITCDINKENLFKITSFTSLWSFP